MNALFGNLERYVLRVIVGAVFSVLAIVSAMIVLIDFVDNARNLGPRSDATFVDLMGLTLMKSPGTIVSLLPFVFLFGTLFAFVTLNRRSELIAMRASGVSAWRFVAPAMLFAFLSGFLVITMLGPLTGLSSSRFEEMRAALRAGYSGTAPDDVWLRQGDGRTEIILHATGYDHSGGVFGLRNVSLFVYSRSQTGNLEFSRQIEAQEARLNAGFWRLTGVREAMPGAGAVRSESLSIPSTLDSEAAMERMAAPSTIPIWRIPAIVQQLDSAGISSLAFRVRLQQILATPVLYMAMSLLAAAFSLRLARLGGLAGLSVAAIALGFAVYFLDHLCLALGRSESLPAVMAAWSPPLLALLSGLALLCYTEDG